MNNINIRCLNSEEISCVAGGFSTAMMSASFGAAIAVGFGVLACCISNCVSSSQEGHYIDPVYGADGQIIAHMGYISPAEQYSDRRSVSRCMFVVSAIGALTTVIGTTVWLVEPVERW